MHQLVPLTGWHKMHAISNFIATWQHMKVNCIFSWVLTTILGTSSDQQDEMVWFQDYYLEWNINLVELTCSIEFGFCSSIMLICWVDRTEWGNIPPWSEESSVRSSSSFSSRQEEARLRLTDLTPATFFCPQEISSLTLLFPKCEMTRERYQLEHNYKRSQNKQKIS